MAGPEYDLVVLGGGIHGCGLAQAAAAAGYRVLLLEQTALAAGTSSRSSKLIHGGLRYLETGELRLVRESLAERRRLLRLAPGLVRLVDHHIPVYPETRRRPGRLWAGLALYALAGGLHRDSLFSRLPRRDWGGLDGLRTRGLQQVFRYRDAQTDDAALTRAVARSAQALGARILVPARFLEAQRQGDTWRVRFQAGFERRLVTARALVNAAGPWVGEILARIPDAGRAIPFELVQGSHILLDRPLHHGVYYVEAPDDGRAVFVMPWRGGGQTLVGTTETPYQGDPARVTPLPEELDYLQRTLAAYFPACRDLRPVASFAGLRVLPGGADTPFRRSRETRLLADCEGTLVSIYGGKLTVYRATAARVLRRLRPVLPRRRARADTARLPLT